MIIVELNKQKKNKINEAFKIIISFKLIFIFVVLWDN